MDSQVKTSEEGATPGTMKEEAESHENACDAIPISLGKRKPANGPCQVWRHFTGIPNSASKKFKCNYCGTHCSYDTTYSSICPLLNHLRLECKKSPLYGTEVDRNQTRKSCVEKLVSFGFDKVRCWESIPKMIILGKLDFKSVENEGFRHFCHECTPQFNTPSWKAVARDCYQLYLEEKNRLRNVLRMASQNVSLTIDTWTSIKNLDYIRVMAHFIDNDRRYQKKVLSFRQLSNRKGDTIGKVIESSLLEWGIKGAFTITLDNDSSYDEAFAYLRKRMSGWGMAMLDGELLHIRCCAQLFNFIVNKGLEKLQSSIARVRNLVRYVRSSPSRLQEFKGCVEQEKLSTSELISLDVPTNWTSTYFMLLSALKFQKAFQRFKEKDDQYLIWFDVDGNKIGPPTQEDWENVHVLVKFLGMFYEMILRLLGSTCGTLDAFFHDLFGLKIRLYSLCNNGDHLVRLMVSNMRSKYDKYWGHLGNFNPLLFIQVVLDPCYKMEYLSWGFEEMYDSNLALEFSQKIKYVLNQLYNHYKTSDVDGGGQNTHEGLASDTNVDDLMLYPFQISFLKKKKKAAENMSEVERYLGESFVEDSSNFDLLGWWKESSRRYKVLAKIARDVLAVPVSTLSLESTFNTKGHVLDDPFRSSLSPKILEAVICAQDWLSAQNIYFTGKDLYKMSKNGQILNQSFYRLD